MNLGEVPIIKYPLKKLDKNPYLLEHKEYFEKRLSGLVTSRFHAAIYKQQKNICPECEESLFNGEAVEMHHIKPQAKGGKYTLANCQALHRVCHVRITTKSNDRKEDAKVAL